MQARQEELNKKSFELVQANADLKLVNSTKDRFFSIIAHDLRNPFHTISNLSEMLINDRAEIEEEQKIELARLINSASSSASNLLENLLQWARSQTNNVVVEKSVFDVYDVIHGNIEFFTPLAKEKRIRIKSNVSPGSFAHADKNMIRTITRNLISNAIKFTGFGGQITLESFKEKDSQVLVVADSGVGMSEEVMNKLFRIDVQQTNPGTNNEKVTGLGLLICKEFIEKNEGRIEVESKIGKGSKFKLFIPYIHLDDKQVQEIVIKKEELEESTGIDTHDIDLPVDPDFKVLVVDDDKGILQSIAGLFRQSYHVLQATNGKQGLELAEKELPDLIISDIHMPKLTGIEMCAVLKTKGETSHIPVVLLTADDDNATKMEGFETGADMYLQKPFNSVELVVRVKNLLESRKNLRERYSREIRMAPSDVVVTSKDEKFLVKAINIVEQNLDNNSFGVDNFVQKMDVSRSLLFMKLKNIAGQTPHEFMKTIRLKRSANLLEARHDTVEQIAYKTGFNSVRSFNRAFKEHFGKTPGEYAKKR